MNESGDLSTFDILIVDDQPPSRDAIRESLAALGWQQVRVVESELQALAEICRQHPDLILMRVVMPGMDGFTAATASEITKRP